MHQRDWAKTVAALFIVLCSVVTRGWAVAAPDFDEANRLYEQGKYPEAIALYQAILKTGRSSSAVWYNLGNACFKHGELGRAICFYLKARALSPRDADIQANLR